MGFRTEDRDYGEDYWSTLDGGRGYRRSTLWTDIAHEIHETYLIDGEAGVDRSGEHSHVDVGCAMGYLVEAMRGRGVESWGLDNSAYALKNAPKAVKPFLRRFDLAFVNDSHFGRERFSLVTCFETLEHIAAEHAEQAVSHLYHLLRPGAQCLATICVEGQEGWDTDPTHVTIWPVEEWRTLFGDIGFLPDKAAEEKLRGYWLFSRHKGVVAVSRPKASE